MASSSFTEAQAQAIKSRFEQGVLALPGVTGVDVGRNAAGEFVIRVFVAAKAAAPPLPGSVEGLPIEVIERRFGLQ